MTSRELHPGIRHMTVRQASRVVEVFNIENIDKAIQDRLQHAGLHVIIAAGKLSEILSDTKDEDEGYSRLDDEVIPDLIMLALQMMHERRQEPVESIINRMRALEARNSTTGSTDRALGVIDPDDDDCFVIEDQSVAETQTLTPDNS